MRFKEIPLDPNFAVSPEKYLFLTWSCKPDKLARPKLNIQISALVFWSESFNKREANILAALLL